MHRLNVSILWMSALATSLGCSDLPAESPGPDDTGQGAGGSATSTSNGGAAATGGSASVGGNTGVGGSTGQSGGGPAVGFCPPGAVFCDDFETGDLSQTGNGFTWDPPYRTAVVAEQPKDGSYSLRFEWGEDADGEDSTAEQRFKLGGNYDELWVRYDVLIPGNYFHRPQSGGPQNNKGFLYLWSGDYGAPSGPGMGPNLWNGPSAGQSDASLYVWGPIDRHWWPDDPAWSGTSIETSDYGTWMAVYMHYKYATASNDDGVAEIWKRPAGGSWQQLLSIDDGDWYLSGQPGFDQGYLWGWANSGFAEVTRIYIDNIAFSTTDFVQPGAQP